MITVRHAFLMKLTSPSGPAITRPSRNPERTQERILKAAFKEFAGKGFAGARVDGIARRAGINKRMLYHYFGDKEALFREVLRRKIAQRQAWGAATPNEPEESLLYWFELACRDADWIRLLEWEALQFIEKRLIDERRRSESVGRAVERIRNRQKLGYLSNDYNPKHMLLAMTALTWFPLAFPQLTRLITGHAFSEPAFQNAHREFLSKFAFAFKPSKAGHEINGAAISNGKRKVTTR
jgi:TetR/AcrR family transcriptional regulator